MTLPAVLTLPVSLDPGPVDGPFAALLGQFTGLTGDPDPLAGTTGAPRWLADPHGLYARATSPDFPAWLAHAARTGGCAHPIRLIGGSITAEQDTGRVLDVFDTDSLPDRVLYKACGNRREAACPACSRVYRWDVYQLVKAGLAGGKGVPDTIAVHPAVFATLVAPSYGIVHTGPSHQHAARIRCRPRRDKPRCRHGRPAFCYAQHQPGEHVLGRPLCLDCYDHDGQVVFNHFAPRLWDRTMTRLRALVRVAGKRVGLRLTVRYAKVAEMQRRGVLHYHAVIRLDAAVGASIATPPPEFTVGWLAALIEQAAAETSYRTPPHPDRADGWLLRWGAPTAGRQADVRPIRRGITDAQITDRHVAGYIAKYATKSTEATGHVARRLTPATVRPYADPDTHPGRLVAACWRLGRPYPRPRQDDDAAGQAYRGLRRWAHELGKGGHYATKSHRYSITLGELRAARQTWRTTPQPAAGPPPPPPGDHTAATAAEHDDTTTVVIAEWTYVGAGWHTTGDAAFALAAADAARQRRPANLTAA